MGVGVVGMCAAVCRWEGKSPDQNAELFLKTNELYDHLTLGRYCENRDPVLAVVAYERGQCDDDLVRVTSKNGMYKQPGTGCFHPS